MERVLGKIISDYLEESGSFGETQWAFRAGHSCRDLVALATSRWILEFHAGNKIGIFLSDISGAFDRVSSELLLRKLEAAGVQDDMLRFLESYLEARVSQVLVEGSKSTEFVLEDSIFQGTVLGPKLWNVFFQDVSTAPPDGFQEMKFADDLTCSKVFPAETSNESIVKELTDCEEAVYDWGVRNQVLFDPQKKSFGILHDSEGDGEDFRFLGSWMDTALRMETNVQKMLGKARPKVTALLRTKRFYETSEMVNQYKTHVLCHLELNTGSFYHALASVLEPMDKLQTHFLAEIGLKPENAFLEHNLLPLRTRRDIAMLGLMFKCAHGQAHEDLRQLFPRHTVVEHSYSTRSICHRHSLQLEEHRPGTKHALLRRSIFGLTRVWNRLPREAVALETTKDFQKILTKYVGMACWRGDVDWADLLSPRPILLQGSAHFRQLHSAVSHRF